MNLNLFRYYGDSYCTLGTFSIEGKEDPIFHTIEKPWVDNQKDISCIPTGKYIIKPFKSTKFQNYPDVWQVMDVPDRTFVLIHVANKAEQLQGCIAPGLSAGYMRYKDDTMKKAVLNSTQAMESLKKILGYPLQLTLTIRG